MATAKSLEVYIYTKDKMKQGHLLYDKRTNTFFVYHSTPIPQFINLVNEDTNNTWQFSKIRMLFSATIRCRYYERHHDSIISRLRVYDNLDSMNEDWDKVREAA